jgi:hypothetical protein
MSKMGSHYPFGHLKHKLWSKERSRVDPNSLRAGNMRHTFQKVSTRATTSVATLLWPSVGVKPNTWKKSEDLESSGTAECSELDNKAQNTSH